MGKFVSVKPEFNPLQALCNNSYTVLKLVCYCVNLNDNAIITHRSICIGTRGAGGPWPSQNLEKCFGSHTSPDNYQSSKHTYHYKLLLY